MTRIATGMVLAAGLGTRMRPLTDDRPKPLVTLAGRTLLDWAVDRFAAAGLDRIVVNTHYKADMIQMHLAQRPGVVLSHEEARLETGGGVKNALPALGRGAFYVCNSDGVWLDGATPALDRLADVWDDDRMDALLLLQPVDAALGYGGPGDYFRKPDGTLRRRGEAAAAPYVFAGLQVIHARLFADAPEGPFSLNILYDKANAAGRLFGLVHDGDWFHVGTPEALADAEAALARETGPGRR
jgi:MurNAc alpha-1-phosphate uridylyltransferase